MTGSLFIITAASGTGKTSLVKQLIENNKNLTVSVSHTTRKPRPGEVNGQQYHFTTVDEFKKGIEVNQFLEYAEVFGNFYGTSAQKVNAQLAQGIDVILEIDWQGALQVKEQLKHSDITPIMIFILPPSKEALKQRLSNRGQDSEEVIQTRLAGAVTEMRQYKNFDYIIINDDFNTAYDELKAIIIANRQTLKKQQTTHGDLINSLITD
ncbi:MAG: guanylate kinase [Gammaproteobacteria bacterium]|nr:MAG: guanylate kinase [Gammaproteobacteria bacterium]